MNRRSFLAIGTAAFCLPTVANADGTCPPADPSYHPFPLSYDICNAYVEPKGIQVSSQQESEWCWAATISNIFAYYGHTVDQSDIVGAGIGQVVNQPGNLLVMHQVLNRQWTDSDGNTFSSHGTPIFSLDLGLPIFSNQTLISALNDNHPLLICNMSHAMMLISVNYIPPETRPGNVVSAIVVDPWPGYGLRSLSPQELKTPPYGQLRLVMRVSVTP